MSAKVFVKIIITCADCPNYDKEGYCEHVGTYVDKDSRPGFECPLSDIYVPDPGMDGI